jgi:hypothetical protein
MEFVEVQALLQKYRFECANNICEHVALSLALAMRGLEHA